MIDVSSILAPTLLILNSVVIVELPSREILLSDIAEVSAGNADLIVAALPKNSSTIEIDVDTARRLLRNRLPGVQFELNFVDRIRLTHTVPPPLSGSCFAAVTAIPADQVIYAEFVGQVGCEDSDTSELVTYDREAEVPVARSMISEGRYIGAITPALSRRIREERTATLTTGGSGVSIERTVTTLQPGREGRNVFVRTSEGEVFPVPLATLQEED